MFFSKSMLLHDYGVLIRARDHLHNCYTVRLAFHRFIDSVPSIIETMLNCKEFSQQGVALIPVAINITPPKPITMAFIL